MALRPLFSDEDDDEYPEPVRGPDGRWPIVDRIEQAIRYPMPWRRTLAAVATDLLRVTDRVLTLGELERLLRLQDLVPAGRPSKTISDSLRAEVAAGRVVRVRRGCYRAA